MKAIACGLPRSQGLPLSRFSRTELLGVVERGVCEASAATIARAVRSPTWPRVFGRCEQRGWIEPFDRLVRQVMTSEPYASAGRLFCIVDNGPSHRGQKAIERLQRRWPSLVRVHLPVHAIWLNQIEIYYSIVQRKVLEPDDVENLADLARTLNAFERLWNEIAEPFDWNFTRDHLAALINRLSAHEPQLQLAA